MGSSAPISSSSAPARRASARCCHRKARSSPISSSSKRRRSMAAASFSTCRALSPSRSWTSSTSTSSARASLSSDFSDTLGVLAAWDGIAPTAFAPFLCRSAPAGARPARDPAAAACGRRRRGPRCRPRRRKRVRGAPHRVGHSAGRRRFSIRRRLPARGRHGSAWRRRFHQRLLRRPGGGFAHGASRQCAHAHRTGSLRRRGTAAGRNRDHGRRTANRRDGFRCHRPRARAVAPRPGGRGDVARRCASRRRRPDPADQAGLGPLCLSRWAPRPPNDCRGRQRSPRRPACALSLAEGRPALPRLSRRGMGRARIRRPRALREARARRLSGRPVLDHHSAQAGEFPSRLRRLCSGKNRALQPEENRRA